VRESPRCRPWPETTLRIISLSLAHLGLGLILIQALVGLREVGRGFFTLCGWSGVGLTVFGWMFSGSTAHPAGEGAAPWAIAVVSALSFAVGWSLLKAKRRDLAAPFHHGAGALAGAAVFVQGWWLALSQPAASAPGSHGLSIAAWTGADFVLSAALLGGVTVAMVLGHWYLVQPGLSIVPLNRLAWVFIVVLALRIIEEAAGAAGAISSGAMSLSPPAGEIVPFPLLILFQRALFGLAAPLVLAPLVYKTVTMRSTMSATGLLYVAVALVWVGEFLSKYLLLPLRMT